jgi:hypothetical protein
MYYLLKYIGSTYYLEYKSNLWICHIVQLPILKYSYHTVSTRNLFLQYINDDKSLFFPYYRTRAIISRGLYIFYPNSKDHFFVFKEVFSENSVFIFGLYCLAYDGARTVIYFSNFLFSFWNISPKHYKSIIEISKFVKSALHLLTNKQAKQ